MRHFKFVLVLTLFFAFFLSSCSKSSTPAPTALQITITDGLGNVVTGASVTLYGSQTDWTNNTNPIGSATSDSKGVVTFTNLSSTTYYWLAQDGCENNIHGSATNQTPLTANATTTITTVLAGTGTLKFVNTSANPYHVYVNGTYIGDVAGGETAISANDVLGSYTIRVLQISGYAVTPTDESFTGTLSCGSTLTTTFP